LPFSTDEAVEASRQIVGRWGVLAGVVCQRPFRGPQRRLFRHSESQRRDEPFYGSGVGNTAEPSLEIRDSSQAQTCLSGKRRLGQPRSHPISSQQSTEALLAFDHPPSSLALTIAHP